MSRDFHALADEKFLSLVTFKRNGDGVGAPVWVVADGGRLLVWTPADTWKVKRLRRDSRVTLAPCGRRGQVDDGVVPVEGTGEVLDDPSVVAKTEAALKRKYGFEYRVVTLVERIAARGSKPRVVISITPA